MLTALTIFHAIISILLIAGVLLQFGKGAEAGLMTAESSAVFTGSQQGNILRTITTVLVVIFLGNALLLSILRSNQSKKSILDNIVPTTTSAPQVPAAPAAPAPMTPAQNPAPAPANK